MSTHECPGGSHRVGSDQLACRVCWFKLPKDLRNEIWTAWRHRVGPEGYKRHADAIQRAVGWFKANT